jgi:molybdenum cofactor guanylyltransferase
MSEAVRRVTRREQIRGGGLGVILAGGLSRRFGSPKILADVAGQSMLHRVRSALSAAVPEVVAIGHDPLLCAAGLQCRPDVSPGGGPMAGLQVALRWAEERELPGVLLVGCDMPFLSAGLLQHIMLKAAATPLAVAPVGHAGGAPEPLCAWYSIALQAEVDERIASGHLAMRALVALPGVELIPPGEVRRFGDPDTIFLNVNTTADRDRAETLAGRLLS